MSHLATTIDGPLPLHVLPETPPFEENAQLAQA
jgi:hypothetical protein